MPFQGGLCGDKRFLRHTREWVLEIHPEREDNKDETYEEVEEFSCPLCRDLSDTFSDSLRRIPKGSGIRNFCRERFPDFLRAGERPGRGGDTG